MDRYKYYNIEAIIKDLKNRSFIRMNEVDTMFTIIMNKLNKLIVSCNNGINSVACLKLNLYIKELREIFKKYDLLVLFNNRLEKHIKRNRDENI